jgi:serine/threonine-protein kinase HipA
MTEPLFVYFESWEIGRLTLDDNYRFLFKYSDDWLLKSDHFPVSLSMPIEQKVYANEAHAYFTNLLPEGALRSLICQKLKISESNHYELLKKIGGECAGVIRVLSEDDDISILPPSYQVLDEHQTAEMMITQGAYGYKSVRLSLAGAQYKLPVYREGDNKLYCPLNGSPSSHILKFPNLLYQHLPEYEILSTAIASKLGLNAIEILPIQLGNGTVASLSKRYDRILRYGSLFRLHQEDFCQVMGKPPYQKYEEENGPGFKDCMAIINKFSSTPVLDRKVLMEWLVFNVLIGNCDAHAKNLSFLFSNGKVRLSPSYDLVCTLMYPRLATSMAMSIGEAKQVQNVKKSDWEILAKQLNLNPKLLLNTVEKMAVTLLDNSKCREELYGIGINEQIIIRLHKKIQKQCRNILTKMGSTSKTGA